MTDETTTNAAGSAGVDGARRVVSPTPGEPDVLVLGVLALALAAVSVVLAASFFFSPLAYIGGGLALFFGHAARGHERSRRLGTTAVVVAVLAMVVATALLV